MYSCVVSANNPFLLIGAVSKTITGLFRSSSAAFPSGFDIISSQKNDFIHRLSSSVSKITTNENHYAQSFTPNCFKTIAIIYHHTTWIFWTRCAVLHMNKLSRALISCEKLAFSSLPGLVWTCIGSPCDRRCLQLLWMCSRPAEC